MCVGDPPSTKDLRTTSLGEYLKRWSIPFFLCLLISMALGF